ncbi:hypothetical protein SAMN06265349_101133 [Flavobacterium resistens]|uniref:Tubby C 2 family protein n=1 Tax=Flavobacterium resistens TaxID=443612 RepID=A0A521AHN6_9FLAO|nr:hypothetical protein [Flavobacterium resistens]MRX69939.1 hypothetical protein [Flavobacterium resistens]SMO34293.1 hypothetical protein SAMN06265349_101133 [Flavobacterium resistens]
MEIEIIRDKNQSLYVYKNDELLFYSKVKFNWTNRIISIFNCNDILLLEVKSKMTFIKSDYEILFQNELIADNISEITNGRIIFGSGKRLYIKQDYFISLDGNFSYYFKEIKISQLKQKTWISKPKLTLNINDENIEFLDTVIYHILAIRAGNNSD